MKLIFINDKEIIHVTLEFHYRLTIHIYEYTNKTLLNSSSSSHVKHFLYFSKACCFTLVECK